MTELPLPTARDWMTTRFLTLSPGGGIYEAISELLSSGFSAAPVVENGKVVGMLTEKDGIRALSQLLYSELAEGATVADHMSKVCPAADPEMDLFQVAELFLQCNFPALPVTQDGTLVGLIRRQAQLKGIDQFRTAVERERERQERAAGLQAERPQGIEALQQAAASTTRDQLVRLFGRRRN